MNQKFCFFGIIVTVLFLLATGFTASIGFILFSILHFVFGFFVSFVDVASNCVAAEDINITVAASAGHKSRLPNASWSDAPDQSSLMCLYIRVSCLEHVAPWVWSGSHHNPFRRSCHRQPFSDIYFVSSFVTSQVVFECGSWAVLCVVILLMDLAVMSILSCYLMQRRLT